MFEDVEVFFRRLELFWSGVFKWVWGSDFFISEKVLVFFEVVGFE